MVTRSRIQAHHYRNGRRGYNGDGKIHGVVLHDMESAERLDTAEDVGRYFARADIRPSSAHKLFDSNSIVIAVDDDDEAYHAPPASRWTLGYEQAGVARQTASEWHDPFSWAMLQIVAAELAADSAKYGFPLVSRSIDDLKAGHIDGVYQHNDVSKAFGKSDHWDCGPGYPQAEVVEMARKGAHQVAPPGASTVMKLGSKGSGVAFLGDMGNIMAQAGFALNKKGKPSHVQIPIPTSKARRELCTFNGAIHARVEEIQRFADVMSRQSGGKPIKVTGVADAQFAKIIAFWIPIALNKIKNK